MRENITAVKLKENISKNSFYSCPGAGTFELKSLTSDLVSGAGNLTNSDFKNSNGPGVAREGSMLKFQIDRYISLELEWFSLLMVIGLSGVQFRL